MSKWSCRSDTGSTEPRNMVWCCHAPPVSLPVVCPPCHVHFAADPSKVTRCPLCSVVWRCWMRGTGGGLPVQRNFSSAASGLRPDRAAGDATPSRLTSPGMFRPKNISLSRSRHIKAQRDFITAAGGSVRRSIDTTTGTGHSPSPAKINPECVSQARAGIPRGAGWGGASRLRSSCSVSGRVQKVSVLSHSWANIHRTLTVLFLELMSAMVDLYKRKEKVPLEDPPHHRPPHHCLWGATLSLELFVFYIWPIGIPDFHNQIQVRCGSDLLLLLPMYQITSGIGSAILCCMVSESLSYIFGNPWLQW